MEVNVSDLTGMALDWAVGMAVGKPLVIRSPIGQPSGPRVVWEQVGDHGGVVRFAPSSNWAHGGPLIDRFIPALQTCTDNEFVALLHSDLDDPSPLLVCAGETYLIALCRVIVADRTGSVVNVPDELLSKRYCALP